MNFKYLECLNLSGLGPTPSSHLFSRPFSEKTERQTKKIHVPMNADQRKWNLLRIVRVSVM